MRPGPITFLPAREARPLPNFEDMQKDPMAALTKGFGWFTSTVSKTAKTVNDGYIQPTAKSEYNTDARRKRLGKNAHDGFNRFVEGNDHARRDAPLDASRKDFWDDFSSLAEQKKANSSIGTSAMGMGKARGSAAPASGQEE
ncbi:hypothetical protein ACCO45_010984 [Purpureocillium lilacinum]|uniref:Uncharacterized protein n=1 Tax=Purpureocillium lilacinum TaxID=33203 RepID=A0ACC4DIZ5_PURLI